MSNKELIVVKSQIKAKAKYMGKQMNLSWDFYEALDKEVEKMLVTACRRAQSNGRSTVMAKDV